MVCPKCGSIFSGEEKFCINCGTLLEQEKNEENNFINNEKIEENISEKKPKKKKIVAIVLLLIIICVLVSGIVIIIKNKLVSKYGNTSQKSEISYTYAENNIPKFIDGSYSTDKITSSSDVLKSLENIKDEMKFSDISKELKLASEETSENITYYRFNQIYKDIPVYNQNIIVAVDKNGSIISLSGYYIPNINIDVNPKKTDEEINKIVSDDIGENSKIISSQLNIMASNNSQRLVFVVDASSNTNALEYLIDASSGKILSKVDVFESASNYSYTGLGLNNKTYTINLEEYFDLTLGAKNKYKFYDASRKIVVQDYRLIGPMLSNLLSAIPGTSPVIVDITDGKIDYSNEAEKTFIESAVTTMANYETIYDYYKNVLGRDSFDNRGSKIQINLGVSASTFSNKDLNNAFWSSMTNQMYIGDWNGKSFSSCLDVLSHEFTHGVISFTSNFAHVTKEEDSDKAFETGALNEGYSDVLGHLIEGKNWTMAENIQALRDAINPEDYKDPSVKGGKYYYPDGYLTDGRTLEQFLKDNNLENVTDYDKGGVHENANVVVHAAYLMYDAGAFKSREEMAKVWYNSLFILSSYSNFEDCALAVIKTAKNLGLSDESVSKIEKAFMDTKMLENKNFILKGIVSSANEKLRDVSIKIYDYNINSLIKTIKTDKNGEFNLELSTGMYKVVASKKGFNEMSITTNVKGNSTLNISLASSKKGADKSNIINSCKGSTCVSVTIYFLDNDDTNKLNENYEIYSIDKGSKIDAKQIVDYANKILKSNMLSTDGKSFYVTASGLQMEFGWYYKGTDNKFDFNLPINEDISIEMKMFDGLIDDNFIKDFSSLFYN